jgi:hypothetical protein
MHGNGENNSDQIGRDAMQGNVGNNECNIPRSRDAMPRVSTGWYDASRLYGVVKCIA